MPTFTKQTLQSEGNKILHYLKEHFKTLDYKDFDICKLGEDKLGGYEPNDRIIYLSEDGFDELSKKKNSKRFIDSFVMALCHEAGHASDEFLKHALFKTKQKPFPGHGTTERAQCEAFATFRSCQMILSLSNYPKSILGKNFTKGELDNLANYTYANGYRITDVEEKDLISNNVIKSPLSPEESAGYYEDFETALVQFNTMFGVYDLGNISKLDNIRKNLTPK